MLSEEEKKAIEFIKSELEDEKKARDDYQSLTGLYGNLEIEILLNLIEKQQKEIEELKKPKYLLNTKTGEITTINNSEFISKDKIKAKIEELEKIIEFEKPTYEDVLKYAIEILQSLLEKE